MWLVALPRSQFSRVASATSRWSELPHNSRPLTFGTLSLPFATPRHLDTVLCGVPWVPMIGVLGPSFFSFWRISLFFLSFFSFDSLRSHPPPKKNFGNLCSLVGLVLRSCSRDLHVLHLTFVSIVLRGYGDDRHLLDSLFAECTLSGPLFCRRKKGPGHSASLRPLYILLLSLSLPLSPSCLLLCYIYIYIYIYIYYPFIVISFFFIFFTLIFSILSHFVLGFDIISSFSHISPSQMAKTMGWSMHNSNSWSKPLASPPAVSSTNPGQYSSFSNNPLPVADTQANPSSSGANPNNTTSPLDTLRAYHKNSTRFPSPQELPAQAPATANLLQIYYAYFHSAHPFILPPAQLLATKGPHVAALLTVIRFLASFFAENAPTEKFRHEAEVALFINTPPRNAFTVQALMLFAIGLHSDNEQEKSAEVKDVALDLAIDLGMNLKEFSENSYDGTQAGRVQAECLRRTWWELYFLDGLIAGFHQKDAFRLWSMPCTVPLPCEEREYATGVCSLSFFFFTSKCGFVLTTA